MTVDHVNRLQLVQMQFVGGGGTAILDHNHAETLVGEAAYAGTDALIGKNSSDDDIADVHIPEQQAQVGTGQCTVGGLEYDYFVVEKGLLDVKASFPSCKTIPANVVGGFACLQHAHMEEKKKHIPATVLAKYLKPVYPNLSALKTAAGVRGATERKRGATDKVYAQMLFEVFNGSAPVGTRLPKSISKHFE